MPPSIRPRAAAVPVFLLASGCGGGAGPADLASLPLRTAVEELRIGSVDEPGATLTYVGDLLVDDDGRIWTAHPQDAAILVHDAAGRRVARLGGSGEGPGEFRAIGSVGRAGDEVWAFDYRLYRFTWFDRAGAMTRVLTVPIDLGERGKIPPPRPRGMLADDRMYGEPPAFSSMVAAGRMDESALVVMDSTGAPGDTLLTLEHSIWAVQDPAGFSGFGSYRGQPSRTR